MWPSQFDPEENAIYDIHPSKLANGLAYAFDGGLLYTIYEEAGLDFQCNIEACDELVNNLQKTSAQPKLGISFVGYSSKSQGTPMSGLGFCFTRRGLNDHEDPSSVSDQELFIAIDIDYIKSVKTDEEAFINELLDLNFECTCQLMRLLVAANSGAAWARQFDLASEEDRSVPEEDSLLVRQKNDERLFKLADETLQDETLFWISVPEKN